MNLELLKETQELIAIELLRIKYQKLIAGALRRLQHDMYKTEAFEPEKACISIAIEQIITGFDISNYPDSLKSLYWEFSQDNPSNKV